MDREDIHIICRNSNWSAKSAQAALEQHVYSDQKAWKKLLTVLMMSLAVGFTTAGIVFFFAFNWDQMSRFVKLGLMESLLVLVVLVVLFSKLNELFKHILLTAASVLVGVLFAVFGQIYQTGATVYDFFFGWTLFIGLWVLAANFSVLWVLFIGLINLTFINYANEVSLVLTPVSTNLSLLVMNIVFYLSFNFLSKKDGKYQMPGWFMKLIFLLIICYASAGCATGIFEKFEWSFAALLLITLILYVTGIRYGLASRQIYYLALIPFSAIFIIVALMIKITATEWMFLSISVFVILSVGYLIKNLFDIQKKWQYE